MLGGVIGLLTLLAPSSGSAEVGSQIMFGPTPKPAKVGSVLWLRTTSQPAFRMSASALPDSVCRTASDTEQARQQFKQQWHSPGEAHFEVLFVGPGTCTIIVQGEGATYHTVTGQLSIPVAKSQQQRPSITRSVRAALLKDAEREANSRGDHHPYDIRTVLTKETAVTRLNGHEDGRLGEGEAYVYFVAMRGNFKLRCRTPARQAVARYCSHGQGSFATPGYPVIDFTVLAGDNEVERTENLESYPKLKPLGAPFRLSTRRGR